jgi:hypothetical protein
VVYIKIENEVFRDAKKVYHTLIISLSAMIPHLTRKKCIHSDGKR